MEDVDPALRRPVVPVMPGFREMALRRMAAERVGLMRDLVGRRKAMGLSQTEVAASMGTSQSAVARLEAGATDVRASTLERYAAAVGSQITWDHATPAISPESPTGRPIVTPQTGRPADAPVPQGQTGQPEELPRPGWPGAPGRPGGPGGPPPGGPGPVPQTRVWMDPHADWQDLLYARLLEKRIVMSSGLLDEEAAPRLSAQLLTLDAEGDEPIRLELQNLRADLSAALAVIGVLDMVRVPVHARVSGELRGPAIVMLAACSRRLAYPNASLAFAEPRMEFGGTATVVTERRQQAERMLDSLYYRIADAAGREADQVREDFRRGRTLTVAEAIGYGLLDDRVARGE
jgi:ATP-dependent protease ClpP protease subunit/transcriptional regulator with XRE-family HTH domain